MVAIQEDIEKNNGVKMQDTPDHRVMNHQKETKLKFRICEAADIVSSLKEAILVKTSFFLLKNLKIHIHFIIKNF